MARCPPLTDEQWGPVVFRTLQETFGKTGYHVIVDQSADARGNLVLTASRIGPAKFAMPEPGKGGGLLIVLEPCTARVLKVRKLTALETHPLPLQTETE